MNAVYMECGISKQAHDQMIKRLEQQAHKVPFYIGLILEVREMHPGMGLRTIYEKVNPDGIGRDSFIELGISYGLCIEPPRISIQTTQAHPSTAYRNLLSGKEFTDVNQVWSSDITYYNLKDKTFYIILIMDVYSRRIVGYQVSDNLRAENNIKALKMALDTRGNCKYGLGLIHHSDRGSQYTSENYTNLLDEFEIQISMCSNVYENTHLERVNGTIKNRYLKYWNMDNLYQLRQRLEQAVYAYNYDKPHESLGKVSPVEYEDILVQTPLDQRKKLEIFTIDKRNWVTDPNQIMLF